MPTDPEALRLRDLRRAPVIKSPERRQREQEAAQAYYAETRGIKAAMEAKYPGCWNV
jgi:hypothetical protein